MDAERLRSAIEDRIALLEGENNTDNRMKCFHQGQIDAYKDILDEIEEMGGDE